MEWRRLPRRACGTEDALYRGHFLRPGMLLESLKWSEVALLGFNGKIFLTATDIVRIKEIHGRQVVLEDGAADPNTDWLGRPVFGLICDHRGDYAGDDEDHAFIVRRT